MTTSATSPEAPDDAYVLARTSGEYQRLRRQAQLWEQVTAQALDRVGIGAGMRCLDVGCGPGEVMRLMAERVGACGRVTGLDNDGRVGQEAVGVLRATVAGQFEFIQADAETIGKPPGGPFGRRLRTYPHFRTDKPGQARHETVRFRGYVVMIMEIRALGVRARPGGVRWW
jgi:SAM-dependent methyltransferase